MRTVRVVLPLPVTQDAADTVSKEVVEEKGGEGGEWDGAHVRNRVGFQVLAPPPSADVVP